MADIYIGNVKGPQGDTGATGPQGAPGNAATVNVGTVSTTAYGNPAQVVNSGTEHAAVLNFTIPQGAPGATVTQLDNLTLNTITTSTDQYPQIQVGDLGRVIFGKIIKFFQDLVTGLAAKVNYSDALTMEEIEASSDLTDKVSAAAASKSLKESLSNYRSWKSLGNTSGIQTMSITLPDDCQDIYVITNVTGTNFISQSLCYYDLTTTIRTFSNGYYRNASENCAVQWSISRTSVGLGLAYMNGTNYGTSATSYWFYR